MKCFGVPSACPKEISRGTSGDASPRMKNGHPQVAVFTRRVKKPEAASEDLHRFIRLLAIRLGFFALVNGELDLGIIA